jgi:hypothetical protein
MKQDKVIQDKITHNKVIHQSAQEFLQSTRLFSGVKKKYVPKSKRTGKQVSNTPLPPLPEKKNQWTTLDELNHENFLRHYVYNVNTFTNRNGSSWKTQDLRNYIQCIYCLERYSYWSQHEPFCKVYNKPCHLCGENRQGFHPSQGDNYHECFYKLLYDIPQIKKEK